MKIIFSVNALAGEMVTIPSISMTKVNGYFVATEGNKYQDRSGYFLMTKSK